MSRGVNSQDGYLEALVKNMPSEMIALYLAIMALIEKDTGAWVFWLIWAILLVLTPLYLAFVKPRSEDSPRPWWQVWIFSPVAFFCWSMTMPGPFANIDSAPMAGSILIALVSGALFPILSMVFAKNSGS